MPAAKTKPVTKPAATKKLTKADELSSLKIRMFEAEKQIDALNTAITVVALSAGVQKKRLDKTTASQYEKFVFNTLHPMIEKGNGFIHQILEERGLLNDTEPQDTK